MLNQGRKECTQTYQVADVVRNLKLAISASTLGVDDTLRNPFPVKVCQKVDQMEVLKRERSITTKPQRGLWVHDLELPPR